MPVLADMEMAREIILPALQQDAMQTLKLQGLLVGNATIRDVRVDNFSEPTAVLLKCREFLNFYARDLEIGRHLLGELSWHWNRPLAFAGVAEPLVALIEENAVIRWQTPCWLYHLTHEVSMGDLLQQVEEQGSLAKPSPEHSALILEHWPYGDAGDLADQVYIAQRLHDAPASGYFVDDKLVSWALTNDDLSMGLMHTLEEHRCLGIGRLVLADITLQMCEEGWTPYCYVVADNEVPMHLLEQMGYVRSEHQYVWLETEPRSA